jgi:hypothetical protein
MGYPYAVLDQIGESFVGHAITVHLVVSYQVSLDTRHSR